MNLSQFKPFKQYSFYDDLIYNQVFKNVTPSQNKILLYTQSIPYSKHCIRSTTLHRKHCTYTKILYSKHCIHLWNENQLMSLFYSYIAGSLHVSGPQVHLQESSYSCSHNHWFSICTALFACSEHANRTVQILNQWLCEQLYELS